MPGPIALIAALLLSSAAGLVLFGDGSVPARAQASSFAIGVGAGVACALLLWRWFNPARLRDLRYLVLLAVFTLAGLLLVFGSGPRGTDTRINLWGVQPVEPIKLLVVLFLASYFTARDVELRRLESTRLLGLSLPRGRDAAPVVVALCATLGLFFLQRDLGPALVLYVVFLGMFVAASGRIALGLLGLGALVGTFWTTHQFLLLQTVSTRIDMWLSPWDNHRPGGVQLAEALWALASGGTYGLGLSGVDIRYLPAGHTDLILAAAGETFGVYAVLGALVLMAMLVAAMATLAWRAADTYLRYVAFGLALLVGTQSALIAAATVGLLPLTGVPLPFMSYGKSATIAHFAALGVVMAIARRSPRGDARVPLSKWAVAPLLAIALAFGAISWQAWQVMVVQADEILVRGALTPQADGVRRYSYNRRLLDLVSVLPRGRILDRHGIVLAEDDEQGRRRYPLGSIAPQAIGHSRAVWADPRTVERSRAEYLRGFALPERVVVVDGTPVVARDYRALVPAFRRRAEANGPLAELRNRNRDVTLTLDARLQQLAMDALERHMPVVRGVRRSRGAAVVLDPASGALLAAVSLPTYDPNAIDEEVLEEMFGGASRAALDRARTEVYAPGSTFKLVTAIAALGAGVDIGRTAACPHETTVTWTYQRREYRRRITDDESERAHGAIAMGRAVAESCNVFFGTVSTWMGPEALWTTAHERLGLTLKDIPTPAVMAEHLADHAYGQALVTVTPLEMAVVAAAVANGGRRVTPSLYPDALVPPETQPRVMPPEHATLLQEWMRDVVRAGTGRRAVVEGLVVAGKTGTAQTKSGDGLSHAWFVGFAYRPDQDPSGGVAYAFLIENGGYGGVAAASAAREFLVRYAAGGIADLNGAP